MSESYFPLQLGNTWTYRVDSRVGTSDYVTWTVTDVRRVGGRDKGELFWCHVTGRALTPSDPHAAGIWTFEDLSLRRPVKAELTAREREVAALIAQDLDTATIAERLFISPWTVQDHCKAIFEKTGTNSRRELRAQVFFHDHLPAIVVRTPLDAIGHLEKAGRAHQHAARRAGDVAGEADRDVEAEGDRVGEREFHLVEVAARPEDAEVGNDPAAWTNEGDGLLGGELVLLVQLQQYLVQLDQLDPQAHQVQHRPFLDLLVQQVAQDLQVQLDLQDQLDQRHHWLQVTML